MTERGPESSVLRALRAEARRAEQERLRDLLTDRINHALDADHRSGIGRRRYGLEEARDLLPKPDEEDDQPWATFVGCAYQDDTAEYVDVGIYTEPDEDGGPDPAPIRLRAVDIDGNATTPYLSIKTARDLIRHLAAACEQAEKAEARLTTDAP